MFTHVVRFWIKPEASDAARSSLLTDCTELLSKIPGIKFISAGKPAPSERDVVDTSYDVGMCIVFDSIAQHDIYQSHPIHQKFISRNKGVWKKVRVVDFE
jgi:hypothetical protein